MSNSLRPPTRSWFRLGTADLLFLALVLGILPTARTSLLDDPGLGWHLRNIDAMWAEGGWLTRDPFSRPPGGGQPWFTNQWVGDLLLRGGEWWGGLNGIAAVAVLFLAFVVRCLYRLLQDDGLPWPVAALWIALTVRAISCNFVARPNLVSLLFVLLTARTCERLHTGQCTRARALWLWPMFALWANTHGGFVGGLLQLGVVLAVELGLALLAGTDLERRAARSRSGFLLLLLAGAFLATLLNPYGLRLYGWIYHLLGDLFFLNVISEWQSPPFHSYGSFKFEVVFLLFPLILALSRRKLTLIELTLTVFWLHFALTGLRFVAIWILVAVPVLARSSVEIPWVAAWLQRLQRHDTWRPLLQPAPGPETWWGSVVVSLALLGLARWGGEFARHGPEHPTAALNRLLEIHQGETVFHEANWGGYLTWHGWPALLTWVDDRMETQGQERIEESIALLQAAPDWEQKLAQYGVRLVCVRTNMPLAYRLAESTAWREIYRDGDAVIFRRRNADQP